MRYINKKVRAKEQAVKHFGDKSITIGRIYDFPRITLDNGKIINLQIQEKYWHEEFDFIYELEITENYEIY